MSDDTRGIIPTSGTSRDDSGRQLAPSDRSVPVRSDSDAGSIAPRSGSTMLAVPLSSSDNIATAPSVSTPQAPVIVSGKDADVINYSNPLATVGDLYLRSLVNPASAGTNTITTAPVGSSGGNGLLIIAVLALAGGAIWYFYGRG